MKGIAWMTVLLVAAASVYAGDERLDRLPPEDRKWLEEEVVYIITEREREVFLSLETVEERKRFIEAFWRKRDPNPATPQNEFKDEHYRRLEHANRFLGRETFRPGWKTDRGRMYIILGEPREIQRYDGYNELVSTELWFYQGDPARGLPSFFYLMFFKRHDIGEYQLYHPVIDGPSALLRGQFTPATDSRQALEVLRQISVELAQASLSFDTSDPADFISGRASLGTDIMMARIEDSPKRAIRTDYADAWLRYGERVSAEYSFNYVPSRSVFAVLVGPEATPFVHYSIELDPQNFSMETDEDQTKFYTTLDVSVEVRDQEGNLVVANEREAYLELTPSQVHQIQAAPFAFQDEFPLVPGDYQISVIWRNRVLTQYTVAEKDITIEPVSSGNPFLSDVILGYRNQLVGGDVKESEMRAFQIGNLRIHPATDGIFPLGETVHLFSQVLGAGPEYELRFTLRNGEEAVMERSTKVGDYHRGPVIEQFPLTRMVGGRYLLEVQLVDPSGTVAAEKSAPLQVSPRTGINRPGFVYRRGFNAQVPGLLALARGEQLWAMKRFDEARQELEKAAAANNPQLPMALWKLAGALIASGEVDRALELLTPLEAEYPQQYEVVGGLGFAFYLKKDFPKAAAYLERARSLRPPDTSLLNALGDSYDRLGDLEKAREAFERSLGLKSDQSEVKERLASMASKDRSKD
ncbi:MAG: GWxTD domain-containing protein [Acidobacteriota bacterium]